MSVSTTGNWHGQSDIWRLRSTMSGHLSSKGPRGPIFDIYVQPAFIPVTLGTCFLWSYPQPMPMFDHVWLWFSWVFCRWDDQATCYMENDLKKGRAITRTPTFSRLSMHRFHRCAGRSHKSRGWWRTRLGFRHARTKNHGFLYVLQTKPMNRHAVAFMCFDGDKSSMNVTIMDHGYGKFPTSMTVGFQSLGLGVMHYFFRPWKPERNPGTLECAGLVCWMFWMFLLASGHVMHLGNGMMMPEWLWAVWLPISSTHPGKQLRDPLPRRQGILFGRGWKHV